MSLDASTRPAGGRSSSPTVASGGCGGPRLLDLQGSTWCAASASVRLRERLTELGVGRGTRVVLSDESTPALALVLVTLMAMDTSIVLLDCGLPSAAVDSIATETGGDVVVGPHLLEHSTDQPAARVLGTAASLAADLTTTCAGHCHVDRALALGRWSRRQDALLMWTSGSSGPPKGLVKSGAAVLSNVDATAAAMGYREDDVLLPLLPLTHQYGMSLVVVWWLVGCALVVGNHRRPLATIRAARASRPTVVDSVPPVFQSLLPVLVAEGVEALGPAVRMWCVGGAPLSPLLAAEFHRVTGQPLLDGYGSTEAGNVALATLEDDQDLGHPLPGVELVVRRADGHPCEVGELGEVWLRSPYLFTRYLGSDVASPLPSSWYRTGDVGSLDEVGRLRVIGRARAVHRGGYTIYPASIELRAAGAGISLVVVALPDDKMGSHLTAVVEDPEGREPQLWAARLRSELPSYETPNRVLVVDAFPRLSNGKADLARLGQLAAAARRVVPGRPEPLVREPGECKSPSSDQTPDDRQVDA